jgi:hypothetical protein
MSGNLRLIRVWLKISAIFAFTLIVSLSPNVSIASTKNAPAGENSTGVLVGLYAKDAYPISIHSAPSAESEVLYEWWGESAALYAEAATVIGARDKSSRWYKLILEGIEYGLPRFYRQIHKMASFNYSYAYVNAEVVEPYDGLAANEEMARIRAGRPPRWKVGDDFRGEVGRRSTGTFKEPVTFQKEPRNGAEKIKMPAGLRYVRCVDGTEDEFPVYYNDIDEVDWALIVSADTYKVLGWMKADEWYKIPEDKK